MDHSHFYETTATICGGLFFASFVIAQLILDRRASGPIATARVAGFLFAALVVGATFFNGMLYSLVELLGPDVATGAGGYVARRLGVVALLVPAVIFLSPVARTALTRNLTFAIRNDPLRVSYGVYLWLLIVALAGAISLTNDTQYAHQPGAQYPTEPWVPIALIIGVGSFVALLATVFCFFTYASEIQPDPPTNPAAEPDVRQDSDARLALIAAGCLIAAAILFGLGMIVTVPNPYSFWVYQVLRWFTVLVSAVTAEVLWNKLPSGKLWKREQVVVAAVTILLVFVVVLKNTAFPFEFSHEYWIHSGLDMWTIAALVFAAIVLLVAAYRPELLSPAKQSQ
jgi:hypothetical protein